MSYKQVDAVITDGIETMCQPALWEMLFTAANTSYDGCTSKERLAVFIVLHLKYPVQSSNIPSFSEILKHNIPNAPALLANFHG